MSEPLIVVGASARAAAGSAIRAGYRPWCVDLFADRDLRAVAPVKRCAVDQYPRGLIGLLNDGPHAPVLLTGGMENHINEAVESIAARRPLWRWSIQQLRAMRDPYVWRQVQLPTSVGIPRVLCEVSNVSGDWVIKRRFSCGGRCVKRWQPGIAMTDDQYLQQYIVGQSYGAVFGHGGWLLGVTEQIIGDERFGVCDFQYAGNVGPVTLTDAQREGLQQVGLQLATRFELTGLFGIDLVIDAAGKCWLIEINPRYTASVELLERCGDFAAMLPNAVTDVKANGNMKVKVTGGKAIVFAKRDCVVGDLYDLFSSDEVADVPDVGAHIEQGQPICTLFTINSAGAPVSDALVTLHDMADRTYTRACV